MFFMHHLLQIKQNTYSIGTSCGPVATQSIVKVLRNLAKSLIFKGKPFIHVFNIFQMQRREW